MQFDRKSEKLDHQIEQLELQLEDLQADEAEAAREMPAADQAPREKSVRRPLPEHLGARLPFAAQSRPSRDAVADGGAPSNMVELTPLCKKVLFLIETLE